MIEQKNGPFFTEKTFPFLRELSSRWEAIREEALRIAPESMGNYWNDFYRGGEWKIYPLLVEDIWKKEEENSIREEVARNRTQCPVAAEVIDLIPGANLGGFSVLGPGCEVLEHDHVDSEGCFICHLGLSVPNDCAITVRGVLRSWEEGDTFVFHENERHSAWNRSDQTRIIMIVSFYDDGSIELPSDITRFIENQ